MLTQNFAGESAVEAKANQGEETVYSHSFPTLAGDRSGK